MNNHLYNKAAVKNCKKKVKNKLIVQLATWFIIITII